ncbi:MAG: hypothetical protein QOC60_1042 [Frankiaceae bacterium]|jgi:hypothetical protein|nr:hypothetical protein [Frankiaceae bacterium]MDQ1715097.1 hypothetical protein [Frankiaceae bacterium]
MSSPARSLHVTVAAYTALALALAGTAASSAPVSVSTRTASAITGAGITDGTVTGADVKDGSLTGADIKDSSLTGADVKDSSLTGADVKNSSLTGADVKDGSLTGADIKKGSIPADRVAGALPGTATGYTKAESDSLYLLKTGKAADANTIDGIDSSALAQGNVTTTSSQTIVPVGTTVHLMTVPGWASVDSLNCSTSVANASVVITSPTTVNVWTESSTNVAGSFLAGLVSAGTPLGKNGWAKFTIGQVAGIGDTSGSAVIDIHTASTTSGCRFIVTAQITH